MSRFAERRRRVRFLRATPRTALRKAHDAGIVLAGISAGANCWFEQYIADSVPDGGLGRGLGWLKGAVCPHLESAAWRQPVLKVLAGPAGRRR